ncbi:flippase [uncultured Acetatifactor sp.]|uniref:flippase n=1 Tax=uncultured Acetatifactor sp. TaxID=1671927 RepID=UPI00260CF092|nr:flippase [uncultured Acetatifactor sp.]
MKQNSIKKNTIFNGVKTLSSIIFPLITFPYINRILQPENVGKINFGQSIISYFALIASLGITTYAIRECSNVRDDKEKLGNTASQIFSINIVTTMIAYAALGAVLFLYRELDNYRNLIIIQSLNIVATTFGADWLNSAMEDFKYVTLRTVAFQFISLALMLLCIHEPDDYLKYAVISLISSAGANVANIWYRRRYCKVRFIWDMEWKRHIVPILSLFVMLLAQTVFNSVDSTMLGLMHGDYEVGIYGIAHKVSNLITQLVASLLWVIMPRMSYYFAEGDYQQMNKLLRKVLGFNALIGLPLAVGTFMLSKDIILIIAGNEFSEASSVLQILMIGFVFNLFGGSFLGNSILLPMKREKTFMIICCIAAVINVIMNYIFIPQYGTIAAAGTTAFCAFAIFILLLFTVDKKVRIERIGRILLSPVLGCAGIVPICLICRGIDGLWIRTAVSVACSALLYGGIVYAGRDELFLDLIVELRKRLLRG